MVDKQLLHTKRKELGLTLEEVGQIVGVSKSTVKKWESGLIANMKRDKISLLAKALQISPLQIMGWEDTTLPGNCLALPTMYPIPIIGEIAAGMPIFADNNIYGYMSLDVKNPDEHFLLKIRGDSMIDARIMDGDLVLIHQQNTAENGDIVACLVDGQSATLKRFKQQGKTILLLPENSAYEPIVLSINDFDDGYARIIGVARRVVFEL